MNKRLIRLTESDLHRIVKESVNKILKEWWDEDGDWVNDDDGDYGEELDTEGKLTPNKYRHHKYKKRGYLGSYD